MSEATNVVTSENLAEFHAQRLGLATEATPVEAEETPTEPVEAEAEPTEGENVGESEPIEADKEAAETENRKQNPKLEKRFSKLTRERAEAEAKAAEAQRRADELEQRLRALEGNNAPKEAEVSNKEPLPSQFTDAFEYARALAEWSAEQALIKRDQEEAERKIQEKRNSVLKTWNERLEATKSELPDYDDMIASSDVAVSDYVRDAIVESEVGPKILYHLAENPEIAEKINGMSTISALREIGKLEAKFEAEKTQEKPKAEKPVPVKSNAPAPINPLKATGSAVTGGSIGSDGEFHGTYAQWKASRKAGKIR